MISNVLQASPLLIYFGTLFAYITSGEIIYLAFFVGAIISNILNTYIKLFFKSHFENIKGFQRPNPPMEGCGIFNDCDKKGSISFGFPSGHVQLVAFMATFWTICLLKKQLYWGIMILWLSVLFVSWHRIITGCHNLIQVFCGELS